MNLELNMSDKQLVARAPSVGQTQPHRTCSDKYSFISTLDIVDGMRADGWRAIDARQNRVYYSDKGGFQKHLVEMIHPDHMYKDLAIRACIVNAHDRTTRYSLFLGAITFVCTNGLISGEILEGLTLRHINQSSEGVVQASQELSRKIEILTEAIKRFKKVTLSELEQAAFAEAVLGFLYKQRDGKVLAPITSDQLLSARHEEQKVPTLWNILNRVQENIIQGGLSGRSVRSGHRMTTKGISAISSDVAINRKLWELSETMSLKA